MTPLEQAVVLLRRCEFVDSSGGEHPKFCPICRAGVGERLGGRHRPHTPTCELAAFLALHPVSTSRGPEVAASGAETDERVRTAAVFVRTMRHYVVSALDVGMTPKHVCRCVHQAAAQYFTHALGRGGEEEALAEAVLELAARELVRELGVASSGGAT